MKVVRVFFVLLRKEGDWLQCSAFASLRLTPFPCTRRGAPAKSRTQQEVTA